MKKPLSHVILSAAKDLSLAVSNQQWPQILPLRFAQGFGSCAQDDMWRHVCNGKP